MFLVRKFTNPSRDSDQPRPALCQVLPNADWDALPADVHDVMVNIQILLRARRRYDHLLPDYGLSAPHGKLADDNQIEVLQTQFPETLKRYEPRFNLGVLDFDVNDDGISFMTATGDLRVCPGTLRFSFTVNSRIILSVHFASSGA